MPKTMRLIDARPIEESLRHAEEIAGKQGDVRAQKALAYALSLFEDAPEIPLRPDEERMKKKKYGTYKNVLLSEDELETLKAEFPDNWEAWIEEVSEGVAKSGKTYKNFLAVIRNWSRREAEKLKESQGGETSFATDDFAELALRKTYGG